MALDHAHRFRRLPWDHWCVVNLGPGTSGKVSSDLHATTVAQLAGEGRVYHRRIYIGIAAPFRRQLVRLENGAMVVNNSRNPACGYDSGLYSVLIRAGESAGYVAKPFAATALFIASVACRLGHSAAAGLAVERNNGFRPHIEWSNQRSAFGRVVFVLDIGSIKSDSPLDDLG